MASIDPSEPSYRGQKRSRPDNQNLEVSATPEISRKRRRLNDHPATGFGRVKKFFADVWSYFWGSSNRESPLDMDKDDDDEVSFIGETLNSSGLHMETIHASEPSMLDMVAGTDKDEVKLVKVVNTAKSYHSTPIERFYGASYRISTRERRAKDKEERKSENVQSQIRKGSAPARMDLSLPQASWRLDKPCFKRRSVGQGRGIYESYKLEELEKYKNVYEKVLLCPDSTIATLTNSFNRTPRRGLNHVADSPFFPKRPLSSALTAHAFASGAITKVQLSAAPSRILGRDIQQPRGHRFNETPSRSQPPLILLDHDEDDQEVIPIQKPKSSVEADADVIEIIDVYSPKSPKSPTTRSTPKKNSFETDLSVQDVCRDDFLKDLMSKYDTRLKSSKELIKEKQVELQHSQEVTQRLQKSVEERLRKHLTITEVAFEEPEEEEEEVISLPPITPDMESVIKNAMASKGQTLVDAFSIPITRRDLDTLLGLNWLNDEIINFYLQMIVERSNSSKNLPRVYAMNTFFYPKLLQSGFGALKRWTRKVDVFAHDLILIPVHLGMHWCLAVVNLKKKGIYYYDSMSGNNDRCLQAIEKYLQDEHLDKKKTSLDTSGFEKVNVKNIPKQMNGSDCGMFACKFAEYLSRNAPISFTQDDMPYFRRRMIYEIVKKTLLHP